MGKKLGVSEARKRKYLKKYEVNSTAANTFKGIEVKIRRSIDVTIRRTVVTHTPPTHTHRHTHTHTSPRRLNEW